MTTTPDLADWLAAHGFTKNPAFNCRDVYDNGPVRVLIDDPEAEAINVYRFTNDHARLLKWEAHFCHAPAPVITAALETALASKKAR